MEKAVAQLVEQSRNLAKITSYETPEPSTWKLKRLFAFAFYNYLQPDSSTITITTKPGKFGFEWIVELD